MLFWRFTIIDGVFHGLGSMTGPRLFYDFLFQSCGGGEGLKKIVLPWLNYFVLEIWRGHYLVAQVGAWRRWCYNSFIKYDKGKPQNKINESLCIPQPSRNRDKGQWIQHKKTWGECHEGCWRVGLGTLHCRQMQEMETSGYLENYSTHGTNKIISFFSIKTALYDVDTVERR